VDSLGRGESVEGRVRSCESSLWMALSCAASSVVLMVSGLGTSKTRVRCDNAYGESTTRPGEQDNAAEVHDGLRCTSLYGTFERP
jgi:hypothetical protein